MKGFMIPFQVRGTLACAALVLTVHAADNLPPLPPAPPAVPLKVLPRHILTSPTGGVQSVSVRPPAPITVTPRPNLIGPQLPPPATRPPQVVTSTPTPPTVLPTNIMTFDADSKTVDVKVGEIAAKFTFYFTNVSTQEVSITALRPSCGCTAAKLPETPWKISPGQTGPLSAEMNVVGSFGFKTKGLTVETSAGNKFLTLMAKLPDAPPPATVVTPTNPPGHTAMARSETERARNMQTALGDRQAVLKGDCAKCHVEPAVGKKGKELYVAACAICHNAERKNAMVVDLYDKYKNVPEHPAPEFWNMFITMGKPGTLMPAFAKEQGGFLSGEQVASLVEYLNKDFFKEEKLIYRDTPMEAVTNQTHTSSITPSLLPASLGTFAVPDGAK